MLSENLCWKDNFGVRYWMNAWQQIIFVQIDKAMAQGFDGLYLDKVDMFEFFEYDPVTDKYIDHRPNPVTGNTYREDMINWVKAVARRARKTNPSAMIIPQNGEQLLKSKPYRAIADGIGIESLFTEDNQKLPLDTVRYRESFLKLITADHKPVLCVDYSTSKALQADVQKAAAQRPYTLLITDQHLTTLGQSP